MNDANTTGTEKRARIKQLLEPGSRGLFTRRWLLLATYNTRVETEDDDD